MKQRYYLLIIAVLTVLLLLQRSCSQPEVLRASTIVVTHDTAYKEIRKTEYKTVNRIAHDTTVLAGDTLFVPDTNALVLQQQYLELAASYRARNIYQDSVAIDSFGYLVVRDTVQYNQLQQRRYDHHYKIPIVTTTITKTLPPAPGFYAGGGLNVAQQKVQNLQVTLLYRNKKDQLIGLHGGITPSGIPSIGISAYGKLPFK